ncbi:MAG: DUF4838 domain-containing protein [Ruminococcaceae bacterium]|nr:DUF4838 domain-containing protein [Oscillospiraceae bacterium]
MMRINIIIHYENGDKFYKLWAHDERNVDFENDAFCAARCTVCFAAEELCNHLGQMGYEVNVTNKKGNGINIILSENGMSGEEFDITRDGNDICLVGNGRIGTLYAAYELLEAQGIRWYSQDETYIPESTGFVFPECRHYKYDMPNGRGFHFEQLSKESVKFIMWMAHNRLNTHLCHANSKKLQQKLGFVFQNGGHVFTDMLNPYNITADGRTYLEAHKDWYGKRDGEITYKNAQHVQFCATNEGLLEELGKIFVDKLKNEWKDADACEMAGFDTWGASCNCEKCRALGNGADMTLYYASAVRDSINRAYESGELKRKVKLKVSAYEGTDSMQPPRNPVPQNLIDAGDFLIYSPILRCYAHDFDDESCGRNAGYKRALEGWLKTGIDVEVNEYYNVSKHEDLPLLFTKRLKNDLKYYIRSGVKANIYMHVPMAEWGVRTLTQYLYAAITRNVDCNVDAQVDKYFSDLFGDNAAEAKKCYEMVESASETVYSWRGWGNTILTRLIGWDGKKPDGNVGKGTHLDGIEEQDGKRALGLLEKALDGLGRIKKKELSKLSTDMFDGIANAVNPIELRKLMAGPQVISKLDEDIRGLIYGRDVYEFMLLCVEYYNALRDDKNTDALFERMAVLADKLSGYTVGAIPEAYEPGVVLPDAFKRSQLKTLYYKIVANRNGEKKNG